MRISTMIVGLLLWGGLLLAAVQPEASVAVAHRLVQAKTDSQPTLPDDLGDQQRGGNAGNAGQAGSAGHAIDWQVLQNVKQQPPRSQILFFTASWCAYCPAAEKDLRENLVPAGWSMGESEFSKIRVLDFDQNRELANRYGVNPPGLVIVRDGQLVQAWNGNPGWRVLSDTCNRATLSAPQMPQAFGDITLGQLSRRQIGLDQGVISLGGGKIVVPKGQVVTFEPGVTAGNGIVSVTITRAELQDDKVLLSAKNFPMRLVLSLGP